MDVVLVSDGGTVDSDFERSGAPGRLEDLRTLLNSWAISNDTRLPEDRILKWVSVPEEWSRHFTDVPFPEPEQVRQLIELRDQVRGVVSGNDLGEGRGEDGSRGDADAILTPDSHVWFRLVGARIVFEGDGSAVGEFQRILFTAAVNETLQRMRPCADCQWVFYDASKNNKRRWCSMVASPGVRGCGSLAKARTYRRKKKD